MSIAMSGMFASEYLAATMGAMFAFDALNVTERRLSSVPLMGGAASLEPDDCPVWRLGVGSLPSSSGV